MGTDIIYNNSCMEGLKELPDRSIHCCVTSPPYWGLRDYGTATWIGGDEECDHVANPNATKKMGNPEFNENRPSRDDTKTKGYYKNSCPKCGAKRIDSQLGLEETPQEYVDNMVKLFRQVRRVLKDDGTLWLNLGDSHSSYKDQSSVQQTLAGKSRGEPIEGKAANRNGKTTTNQVKNVAIP